MDSNTHARIGDITDKRRVLPLSLSLSLSLSRWPSIEFLPLQKRLTYLSIGNVAPPAIPSTERDKRHTERIIDSLGDALATTRRKRELRMRMNGVGCFRAPDESQLDVVTRARTTEN